jgi:cell division transport system permease protein
MSKNFEKFQKHRLITSYFSVVLSVFLVCFLLGALALFVLQSKKISNEYKENIAYTVFLKKETNDSLIKAFEKDLLSKSYIKSVTFIHKDSAASKHIDDLGEDFLTFLGFNPLDDSFDVYLKSDFVHKDSLAKINRYIKANAFVSDVVYDKSLVDMVNENVKKITLWVLIVSGVFFVIAILLINISLRLSIYTHRFTIKTMQLVGATKSFIRKPFIKRNILLGLVGAILAIIAITALLAYLNYYNPDLKLFDNMLQIVFVFLGLLVFGFLISFISTYRSTQKYLNLKTDYLY